MVLALLLAGRMVRPLEALTEASARIGRGDLSSPNPRAGGSETAILAATMEEMRDRLLHLTAELRRRQAEAEAVLGGIAEGVFAVDRERRITYMNPQTAGLLGIGREGIVGRFCGDVLRPELPGGGRPCEDRCPILDARFRGGASAVEHLVLRDGRRKTVLIASAPPAPASADHPEGSRQFQVMREETETEAARRLRDAVVANVSHEFRTPLSAQLASIEMLRDRLREAPVEGVEELVRSIERAALRLTRLIDNLLESLRIEAGRDSIRRQEVALEQVVEEATELTGSLIQQKGQRLGVELPYPFPMVTGDAPRLTQVLVNLLANANKFAPPGSSPRSRCGSRTRDRASRRTSGSTCSSASAGLPARSPRRAGWGWACGSCTRSSRATAGGSRLATRERAPASRSSCRARCPMKLLVVDDDLELLGLVAYALRQAGYLVIEATDGPSGLAALVEERPDLAILDVNLPRFDGLELLRRARERGLKTPVLMLTVRSSEEDLVQALDLGADDYLTKPFSPRTLLARVRALLRRSGLERPATLTVGELTLDPVEQSVRVGERGVSLTRLEFRLLQLLAANAGHALPAERLIAHVWGSRGHGDRQLLKQLVHRLRQKIEADPAIPRRLVTDPGHGYRLGTDLSTDGE
jgi:DNA-binding response OmpR family regulator/nitrogen-specific signal transduction histidine kinase